MKIIIVSLVLAFSASTVLMSFTLDSNDNNKRVELSPDQNEWGNWKTASCYRYLKYRVKKKSYANEWAIEFKNGYNKSMSMSVTIEDGYGGDRFTIPSGDSRVRSAYYTDNKQATSINFGVDKVKFGDTGWGGPYASCDD
ncbi:MAG: hypothetical protein ACI865_001905 [Flavobacteriaceae bacterium]|jgi:hypothetical protein